MLSTDISLSSFSVMYSDAWRTCVCVCVCVCVQQARLSFDPRTQTRGKEGGGDWGERHLGRRERDLREPLCACVRVVFLSHRESARARASERARRERERERETLDNRASSLSFWSELTVRVIRRLSALAATNSQKVSVLP
jgi:hypothetical protein